MVSLQFAQHAEEKLAIRFARIALGYQHPSKITGKGVRERRLECRSRGERPLGNRHSLHQSGNALLIIAQTRQGVLGEGAPGDIVGDERIAVAVAANP